MKRRERDRSAPQGPARLELHIDELVLHGFAAGEHGRISDAVQRELTRLLSERGVTVPAAPGDEISLPSGSASFTATRSRPDDTGRQVARAVYGQLSGSLAHPKRGR